MAIKIGSQVVFLPDVLVQEVGDELVMLDLASQNYFGLNAVGTSMWRSLARCQSLESAAVELEHEYAVDAQRIREDLIQFVDTLVNRGLLRIQE